MTWKSMQIFDVDGYYSWESCSSKCDDFSTYGDIVCDACPKSIPRGFNISNIYKRVNLETFSGSFKTLLKQEFKDVTGKLRVIPYENKKDVYILQWQRQPGAAWLAVFVAKLYKADPPIKTLLSRVRRVFKRR